MLYHICLLVFIVKARFSGAVNITNVKKKEGPLFFFNFLLLLTLRKNVNTKSDQ